MTTLEKLEELDGAVAGMSVDDSVARYAYKRGLFVLAQSGDNMQILNDEKFVPRVFGEKRKLQHRKKKMKKYHDVKNIRFDETFILISIGNLAALFINI